MAHTALQLRRLLRSPLVAAFACTAFCAAWCAGEGIEAAAAPPAHPEQHRAGIPSVVPPVTRGLVAFWAFQEPAGQPRVDAVHGYGLRDANASASGSVARRAGPGIFGPYAASFTSGQQLVAAREAVPAVSGIGGANATVSVVAWVSPAQVRGGALIAGSWDESKGARQFALFMDGTAGCKPAGAMVAHISGAGVPEGGRRYCASAACGATPLAPGAWHCIANVYDGRSIRAYVNGSLDAAPPPPAHDPRNPLAYPDPPSFPTGGVYVPPTPSQGSDFTVGANFIHAGGGVGPGELGNKYDGGIGGVAVYNTSLTPAEVRLVCGSMDGMHFR